MHSKKDYSELINICHPELACRGGAERRLVEGSIYYRQNSRITLSQACQGVLFLHIRHLSDLILHTSRIKPYSS